MDKQKRILVCGAGGFIGSHVARELHNAGHYVRVADVKWDGYLPEPYYSDKVTADLRDPKNCEWVARDVDEIYQFAANMGGIGFITEKAADVVYDNALINLYMAIEAARARARILYASSACIYPNYLQEDAEVKPLAESDAMPADPNEAYGWEKLFSEVVYQSFARDYGLDIRIVRYHNIYGPCYDTETEVLTTNGFKPFPDVVSDDKIATLNPDTNTLEFHKPVAIQRYFYDGLMVHFNSSRIDLLVTPDHSMYCSTHRGSRMKLQKATDCLGWQQVFMSRFVPCRQGDATVAKVLPTARMSDGRTLQNKNGQQRIIPIETWLEFLGWYLSEGSCFTTKANHIVCITQYDERNRERIAQVIRDLGYHPHMNGHNIRVCSKQLYSEVQQFGHSHDRFIPRWILELSPAQLQHLFTTLMAGDGTADGRKYTTVSKRLADAVQEIALKLGLGAQIGQEADIYRVYITKETLHRIDRDCMYECSYKGMVYDVTVPNHILLVRRNGKVVWSGNCGTYDGGREKAPSALCRKVARAEDGTSIEVWGDGQATRSFCYITDCVAGTISLMESNWTQPINIGSDRLVTVDELAQMAIAASGKKLELVHDLTKPQGVRGRNADLTLVKKVLDWQPVVTMEEGMQNTYSWIAKQVEEAKQ